MMNRKEAEQFARQMVLRQKSTGKTLMQVKPCQCCGSGIGEAYTMRVYTDRKPNAQKSIAVLCEDCLLIPRDTIRAMKLYRAKNKG